MNDEIGYKIIEKLNTLTKLSAWALLRDKELKERIMILSKMGMKPKEIAELLGITPNNVRTRLSMIKKEEHEKSKKGIKKSLGGKENE